jgi:hypothetical protein
VALDWDDRAFLFYFRVPGLAEKEMNESEQAGTTRKRDYE